MKEIVKKISNLQLSKIKEKDPEGFKTKQSLLRGQRITVKYNVTPKVQKAFEGIIVRIRKINRIWSFVSVLNYDSDLRVEKSFAIHNPNTLITNVTNIKRFRKANSMYLMDIDNPRKSTSTYK